MGLKTKLKTFFLLDEEENEILEEETVQKQPVQEPIRETIKRQQPVNSSQAPRQNVVSLQSVQKQSKVILVEPRVYAEAQEIADHLNNHRSVVVNLQRIQHDQALRIVDFLSGTVYAIGGDIQRVGSNIFLCTPDTVEVTGNITELLQENDLHDSRWS